MEWNRLNILLDECLSNLLVGIRVEEKPPEALLCVGDDGGVDVADVRGGVGVVDRRRHQVAAGRVAGERNTSDNMRKCSDQVLCKGVKGSKKTDVKTSLFCAP